MSHLAFRAPPGARAAIRRANAAADRPRHKLRDRLVASLANRTNGYNLP
jgi:hypothetical protein